MNTIKHIIWDADGVLLDSFKTDLSVYAEIANRRSAKSFDFDTNLAEKLLHENKSFQEIVKTLFGIETNPGIRIVSEQFTKIASELEFFIKIRLFDGIQDILKWVQSKNIIQSVATARDLRLTINLFENLGVTELRHIHGGDISAVAKTGDMSSLDKEIMLNNLTSLYDDISHENCLFITDSISDIELGKDFGIPTVGVGYGFCDFEYIKRAEPTFTAETINDLSQLLKKLIA